ncbi:hypothetical protein [Streptomyces chrestomyceticus]|uniref:Uncharacterized protein n=1 Tax=Streptomyces chrestomyceticus TaxID=68185 RepID=A0ABU7WSW4_9ACTN
MSQQYLGSVGKIDRAQILLADVGGGAAVLAVTPLTMGSGTPLFSQKTAFDPVLYERTDAVLLDSGTVFLTYDKSTGETA